MRRKRPSRRRAAEQRDELAAFHCPVSPVPPTGRIAHLSTVGAAALRDLSPAYVADGPSRDFCGTAALPLKPDIRWRGYDLNSLRLDARRLDDRPPFFCFGLLQCAEDVGSLLVARRNFLANVGEPLPHRGMPRLQQLQH